MRAAALLAVVCVLGCAGAQTGQAAAHRVLFENEYVRVVELRLAPGQRTAPHDRSAVARYALPGRSIEVERKSDPPPFEGPYLDPVALAPNEYRLLAEDEAFRVIEVTRAPGVESVLHSHRAGIVYALTGAHLRQAAPGTTPVERTLPAGQVAPIPVTAGHTETNLAATELRAVIFELK